MDRKHAWKVEPNLIDRPLNALADNGFKWMSGHKANGFKPLKDGQTILITEPTPKTIGYMRYWFYLDHSEEEFDITEVTEELLNEMESEGITSTFAYESDGRDLWKLFCDEEDDEFDDPVNHPSHYNHGELETITIIRMLLTEEEYRGYLKGNILKYRERAPYKGNAEQDYAKARWYYDELMEILNNEQTRFAKATR